MNYKRLEVFLEFLIFGIAAGITEDLIAITLTTDEPLTWHIVGIVALVALPFAVVGEVFVDRIDLLSVFFRQRKRRG